MSKKRFATHIFQSTFVAKSCAYILRAFLFVLSLTLRIRIQGQKELETALKNRFSKPVLVALWHNRLLLLAPLMRRAFSTPIPFSVLISKSRDGVLPSVYAETYKGVRVIRVQHDKRQNALSETLQELSAGTVVIFTPDGPRGPRYTIKPGILFAQEKADAIIVAMHWEASRAWYLNTWDHFCIPKPFSTITLTFSLVANEGTLEAREEALKKALQVPSITFGSVGQSSASST